MNDRVHVKKKILLVNKYKEIYDMKKLKYFVANILGPVSRQL